MRTSFDAILIGSLSCGTEQADRAPHPACPDRARAALCSWPRGVGRELRMVSVSHASSVRQAFLSEARLRGTVKLLSSGLIVAALFRKTGQRCAMEVLPLRLDLTSILSVNARYDTK